jgi:hypothetical protein
MVKNAWLSNTVINKPVRDDSPRFLEKATSAQSSSQNTTSSCCTHELKSSIIINVCLLIAVQAALINVL